jgi:hypothetical protein
MPTKKKAARHDLVPGTRRLRAQEIFHAAVENAREEQALRAPGRSQGIAGGLTMGLTGRA